MCAGPGNGHAFSDSSFFDRDTYAYCSYDARITLGTTGHTYNHYAPFQAIPTLLAGTLTEYDGFWSQLQVNTGATATYGFHFQAIPNTAGGAIQNQYGFSVQAPLGASTSTAFGTVNNWSLYSPDQANNSVHAGPFFFASGTESALTYAGAISGFAGALEIGQNVVVDLVRGDFYPLVANSSYCLLELHTPGSNSGAMFCGPTPSSLNSPITIFPVAWEFGYSSFTGSDHWGFARIGDNGPKMYSTVANLVQFNGGASTNPALLFGSSPALITVKAADNSSACGLTVTGTLTATTLALTNAVSVANGGTGLQSLTAHAVLLGQGTSNVGFATIGTAGRVLIDQGASADPSFKAISGDASLTSTGAITVSKFNGGTSFGTLAGQSGIFSGTSSGTNTGDITLTTTGTSGAATYTGTPGTLNIPNYTYTLPTASASVLGGVKVDGTSITITGGVISSTGGGGGITALTGDVTASGTGSVAATVAAIAGVAVGTPTGTGNVAFSASPTFTGTVTAAAIAASGAISTSQNGAASAPALSLTGTPFVGTGTTSTPLLYFNNAVTQPASWNASASGGTYLGFNVQSGFAGNVIDIHNNGGTSVWKVDGFGAMTVGNTATMQAINAFGKISSGVASASTPAFTTTVSPYAAGTGTTNQPQWFAQGTGAAAVTTFPAGGTVFGSNQASGFAGNHVGLYTNGTVSLTINSGGSIFSNAATVTSAGAAGANGPSLAMAFAGYGIGANSNGETVFILNSVAAARMGNGATVASTGAFQWANTTNVGVNATPDTFLTRKAAANIQHGAADAAAPVAQTLSVQSVVAGTTNTAGALWTFIDSAGTGTGVSGGYVFQVHPAGTTGASQNAAVTALTIDSTKTVTFAGTPRFNGTNSTGSGTASLGTNCPAVTPAAPYTWVSVVTSDGSAAFVPAWK